MADVTGPLPSNYVYIGRGSTSRQLGPSFWRNPFHIGPDGSRHEVIERFRAKLLGDSQMMDLIPSLAGSVLVCHCARHEACHGDVLVEVFRAQSAVNAGDAAALLDGPTSDEDCTGARKPPAGSGWRGRGHPLQVGSGATWRELRDGGGLCSPGRWSPRLRAVPPLAHSVADAVRRGIHAAASVGQGSSCASSPYDPGSEDIKSYSRRLVGILASGHAADDPLLGADLEAKKFLTALAESWGFVRCEEPIHPANVLDIDLIGFLARALDDPDASFVCMLRRGVPLGWNVRLPRTPAVFDRKTRWAAHVGTEPEDREWTRNYTSAEDVATDIRSTFLEQEREGMMVRSTLGAARDRYGDRLRVAALGAVPQGQTKRVIHDGTHGAGVNARIVVRDQEAVPTHADLRCVLEQAVRDGVTADFALVFDASKAHRRIGVRPEDWGLQACSLVPRGRSPVSGDEVWLNTVGTYGVGSASYWWGRLGALLVRLAVYVASDSGLLYTLRFADDFIMLVNSARLSAPLALVVVFMRALGVPLKWSKFRGGQVCDWIGFHLSLRESLLGVSSSRGDWIIRWCTATADAGRAKPREVREALGRLSFVAGVLVFVRPFLGPIFAWVAVPPPDAVADLPPMVIMALRWVAKKVGQRHMVRYGLPRTHRGELFRSDAKAEGDHVCIGGWELNGSDDPRLARWFSLELGRAEVPWAYRRGDPFRSIASLELLAVLVCVVVFRPSSGCLAGGVVSLTASVDNQSNGFTLDKFGTTKYPLGLVLMELAERLEEASLLLSVSWRPREENEPADALTNGVFGGFDASRRVVVTWADVQARFTVLPGLVEAAGLLYDDLHTQKQRSRVGRPPSAAPGGGARDRKRHRGDALRERQPW